MSQEHVNGEDEIQRAKSVVHCWVTTFGKQGLPQSIFHIKYTNYLLCLQDC